MSALERRIEIAAAVLLSLTTILTAWTAFQSAKWSGVQAIAFNEAGAARTESVRFSTVAGQQAAVDVSLFVRWAEAVALDQRDLETFLRERFRAEFTPALDAWLASDPLNNPQAPASPFEMEEYRLEAEETASELAAIAETRGGEGREANQTSDNYVLTTVFFAVVLFFVGVGTKFEGEKVRVALLAVATVGLIGGALTIVTFPIEL